MRLRQARLYLLISGATVLALVIMAVSGIVVPAPGSAQPAGSMEISAKALDDYSCEDGEWHFVITQIESEDKVPGHITVKWANGDTKNVPLSDPGYTGKTAHYVTTANLDSRVVSATATIYSGWSGQFNLSHGPCKKEKTPTPTNTPKVEKETPTPTKTPKPEDTATPTQTAVPTETPVVETATPTPTNTPGPADTATATPTPTNTPGPGPADTATPTPTSPPSAPPAVDTATPTPTPVPEVLAEEPPPPVVAAETPPAPTPTPRIEVLPAAGAGSLAGTALPLSLVVVNALGLAGLGIAAVAGWRRRG